MSATVKAIEKSFKVSKERGWDYTFWAIDIHETMVKPNWSQVELPTEWYPVAKEVMQMISKRKDIRLILWTCSWPNEIEKYLKFFESEGVHFDHVNSNSEVKNTGYGYYADKPYFNVLLDDKAGFDPETDWEIIRQLLINKYPEQK